MGLDGIFIVGLTVACLFRFHVQFTPLVHAVDDGKETFAIVGDVILHSRGDFGEDGSFYDAIHLQFTQLVGERLFADFLDVFLQQAVPISVGTNHVDDAGFPFSADDVHAVNYGAVTGGEIFGLFQGSFFIGLIGLKSCTIPFNLVYTTFVVKGNRFVHSKLNESTMNRIAVMITMHFDHSKGNFEELRQKEMAHVMSWKDQGFLDSFFIKSERDGAMILFQNLQMKEVIEKVEALPLFPFMEEVKYLSFEKGF